MCGKTSDLRQIFHRQFFPFIFIPAFPLGRVAGAAALGPEIPHGQQQSQKLSWLHTKTDKASLEM